MSTVQPLEQNSISNTTQQSGLTPSFNLQKSQLNNLMAEKEVSISEQERLSSEIQSEKKITEDHFTAQQLSEYIKNHPNLDNVHHKVAALYKKDLSNLIEHLTMAIRENKPAILLSLIGCIPGDISSEKIKKVDALFLEQNPDKSTLLQFAQACDSKECRFVLMQNGANAENMFKDPSWVSRKLKL